MTPIAAPSPPNQSSLLTRIAVAASIAVHVVAVALSLGYAGAGLYESEPEAVAVNLVTPDEAPPPPEPLTPPVEQKPEPDLSKLDLRVSPLDKPLQPSQQQAPQSQAARQKPAEAKSQATKLALQQEKAQPTAAPPPTAAPSPAAGQPAYALPQPDISLRYQVDLGLKALPAAAPPPNAPRDGNADFDDAATQKADIGKSSVAALRDRLKECAALPAEIDPADKVVIVLRAMFTPDAHLAAPPTLIEASASAKGPLLMRTAISALQACQPYAALPADKYQEWKVMDLRFTPQDFRRG